MTTTVRKLDLDLLERIAFPPEHPMTLVDLRAYAYAQKAGEVPEPRIAEHVASCAHCERELGFVRATDPILNGDEDERTAALMVLAQSSERQRAVEETARTAVKTVAAAGLGKIADVAAAAYHAVARRG